MVPAPMAPNSTSSLARDCAATPALFSRIYRVLMTAARAEGIGADQLPGFLSLEDGGELALLGQEELSMSVMV
jgi:hypothetical protein